MGLIELDKFKKSGKGSPLFLNSEEIDKHCRVENPDRSAPCCGNICSDTAQMVLMQLRIMSGHSLKLNLQAIRRDIEARFQPIPISQGAPQRPTDSSV